MRVQSYSRSFLHCVSDDLLRCAATRSQKNEASDNAPASLRRLVPPLFYGQNDAVRCSFRSKSQVKALLHPKQQRLFRGPRIDVVTFATVKLLLFFELTKENVRKVRISLSSRLFRPMYLQKPIEDEGGGRMKQEVRGKREEGLNLAERKKEKSGVQKSKRSSSSDDLSALPLGLEPRTP